MWIAQSLRGLRLLNAQDHPLPSETRSTSRNGERGEVIYALPHPQIGQAAVELSFWDDATTFPVDIGLTAPPPDAP